MDRHLALDVLKTARTVGNYRAAIAGRSRVREIYPDADDDRPPADEERSDGFSASQRSRGAIVWQEYLEPKVFILRSLRTVIREDEVGLDGGRES